MPYGSDFIYHAIIASTKLPDVLRPKSPGEQVNTHVVESVKEPQPDFVAMQRLLSSVEPAKRMPEHDDKEK